MVGKQIESQAIAEQNFFTYALKGQYKEQLAGLDAGIADMNQQIKLTEVEMRKIQAEIDEMMVE